MILEFRNRRVGDVSEDARGNQTTEDNRKRPRETYQDARGQAFRV